MLRELWERAVVACRGLWLRLCKRRVPRVAARKWWRMEARTEVAMERRLSEFLDLPEAFEEVAFDLMALVASKATVEQTEVHHVQSLLVARMLNDMRASVLLCLRGYTSQGWAVAASCFESSYSVGFIGTDQGAAKRWLAHASFQSPPWNCNDSVLRTIAFLEIGTDSLERDRLTKVEYRLYERLCMGKHANPISERNRYTAKSAEGTSRLVLTPVFTEGRLTEAKLALAVASRAVGTGLWAYLRAQAPNAAVIQGRLFTIVQRTHELATTLPKPAAV